MKKNRMKSRIFLIILFFNIANLTCAFENVISVYFDKSPGLINNKIFGNNLIGYDPKTYENTDKEYYGYSDYGAGIWDFKWNKPLKEVIDLAKGTGATVLRFPGGCGTHRYNWKNAIGKNRKHFLYGIDEFLKTCEATGAEPVITVSYFTGDEQDAADLVKYVNVPGDAEKNNGEMAWPAERVNNGHSLPYKVKYFEIGNEEWHGDHKNIKKVLPEEYAQKYLEYYDAMKMADPSIKIGCILRSEERNKTGWNKKVLEIIKDKLDFGIIHTYPSPEENKEQLEKIDAKEIFKNTLAVPIAKDEYNFREALKLLKEKAGKDIPLAITEYNGGFTQEKPVPYRHCLGTALLNAELLKIFMKLENNILMANYWQFNNSYWGMIANGFDGTEKTLINPYFKRPNYYVLEMYARHFGDALIDAGVKCDSYDVSQYRTLKQRIKDFVNRGIISGGDLLGKKWDIKEFKGANVIETSGVLEINFVDPGEFNYYHSVKHAKVDSGAYYKLSGYIKTENMNSPIGVCIEVQDSRGWNQTKSAAATENITGTNDWQYVEVIYETLPDAKEVNVIARRAGKKGPLKGKVYFKEVKLEKFIPSLDTKIPYLSVNASKSKDGKKVFLMVINKNMDDSITSAIDLKDFVPAEEGDAWILNGPGVDATNEKDHDNVKVTQKKFKVQGSGVKAEELELKSSQPAASTQQPVTRFEFTFEPHSLTAIEIEGKQ